MNYRHAFHAGNFADVFKHILLARMIKYMQRKDKGFRVYDTHSGLGMYDLSSEEAQKTGEWTDGVDKVLKATPPKEVGRLITDWESAVEAAGEQKYPGSPFLAHHLLRKQDRLSLYELHPEDHDILANNFANDYQTRVNHMDGWMAPNSQIPPKEARGIMLIDPPFEDGHDFDRMIDALEKARKRWAGGTIALWYPVKKRDHTDEWLGSLKGLQFPKLLNAEIYIREPRSASMLNGCGMVIANPPFTLANELHILLPWLAEIMKKDRGSGYRLQDLSSR